MLSYLAPAEVATGAAKPLDTRPIAGVKMSDVNDKLLLTVSLSSFSCPRRNELDQKPVRRPKNRAVGFNSLAYPDRHPLVIDTAHYSFTCDLHTAQIWVYWHDQEGHHM